MTAARLHSRRRDSHVQYGMVAMDKPASWAGGAAQLEPGPRHDAIDRPSRRRPLRDCSLFQDALRQGPRQHRRHAQRRASTVFRAAPAAVVARLAPAPVIAAPTPAPAGAGPQSIIALVSSDGGFSETVPVGMGGQTVMMTIDTGAMFGVITKSTADMLIASGTAVEAEGGTATLV